MPENDNDAVAPEETQVANEGDRLKKVLDALAAMDIVLSDDTNEENFLEHLEQALLTAQAQAGESPAEPPNRLLQRWLPLGSNSVKKMSVWPAVVRGPPPKSTTS